MAKSLYSLMLSDEVVAQIDRLAARGLTNRSNMVNQILAEYCSLVTPEKRIRNIFEEMGRLFEGDEELTAIITPNQPTMMVKTSLAFRYRPTVRYDLRLYPVVTDGCVGELGLSFRSQSEELLALTRQFFELWAREEAKLLRKYGPLPRYELVPGHLGRSVRLYDESMSSEDLAEGISRYVRMLDRVLKDYCAGRMTDGDVAGILRAWEAGHLLV